ncbi:MAG: citrate lyase, alpha subunit [Clostridia bacterium]|jgi:citrate lyase subunit alpha/citrate CoA-transferase|nr:citrate lyase, alpha subunit [Clostridia bacterium]
MKYMKNSVEEELKAYTEILGNLEPLSEEKRNAIPKETQCSRDKQIHKNKVVKSLKEAIVLSGLKSGMTISFHHHFRNGDYILNMTLDAIAEMGIGDLTIAASSLSEIHAPMIEHIKNGVIKRFETSGLRGALADEVSNGLMKIPVVFRSHGGRASAIAEGELKIDVAFLGAPSCDPYGNANGYSRDDENSSCCGSLGYAKVDAQYAEKVIILTDNLVPFPNAPFAIPEHQVDYIVRVDAIGDPEKIMSGATRYTNNPRDILIAQTAANVIEASGYFEDGFSFQMGSGGAALATARFLRDKMIAKNIKASFALGGITGQIVALHQEGLVKKILDVQSFDLVAAKSLKDNRFHQQIDASYYASPTDQGSSVNQLDVVVLSALEIDTDFNVNVLTGSDGVIRGAIGGHCDTAAGASVSIIVAPLIRGRIPTVVEKINTLVTPGSTVDVLVTDQGVCVNPRRPELKERLLQSGIEVSDIVTLKEKAENITGKPDPIQYTDKIVGIVQYRNGKVIDVVRQVVK